VSRILVTGAAGFIGRATVEALADAGHIVRAGVRAQPARFAPNIEVKVHGDFAEAVDWRPLIGGIDAVVHLAGIAHAGRGTAEDVYERVNHRAAAELAEAARRAGVKQVLFVSSIRAQTGPSADHVVTEADTPRPTSAYGRSKLAAELALAQSGAPFTILRPVLVYGPGVKGNLAALMRFAALPVPLPFGALTNLRSMVSLANLIAAIRHVLMREGSLGETYLVADPHPVSPAEVVAALRAGLGKPPGLIAMPPGLVRAALTALGRRPMWDQIGGSLVANPAKLIASGWCPDPDTKSALAALARRLGGDSKGSTL
jgi:nucleoside-diphosphate-sugar epimerase